MIFCSAALDTRFPDFQIILLPVAQQSCYSLLTICIDKFVNLQLLFSERHAFSFSGRKPIRLFLVPPGNRKTFVFPLQYNYSGICRQAAVFRQCAKLDLFIFSFYVFCVIHFSLLNHSPLSFFRMKKGIEHVFYFNQLSALLSITRSH